MRQSCAVFRKKLQICDLRINHENLWICDLLNSINLRIELKNLQICNLQTFKKVSLPTSAIQYTPSLGKSKTLLDVSSGAESDGRMWNIEASCAAPTGTTALQRKSHLCITFLGIAWSQPQFPHSCVCERFI